MELPPILNLLLGYISSFPNSVINSPIIISSGEFVNPPFTFRCLESFFQRIAPLLISEVQAYINSAGEVFVTHTAILTQLHAQGVRMGKIVSIWGTVFFF
jgi:hypothetical protein